ncbi:MAG: hypothetical protein QXF15_02375 [Candidatus Aenigmatarchaeota archaeon]
MIKRAEKEFEKISPKELIEIEFRDDNSIKTPTNKYGKVLDNYISRVSTVFNGHDFNTILLGDPGSGKTYFVLGLTKYFNSEYFKQPCNPENTVKFYYIDKEEDFSSREMNIKGFPRGVGIIDDFDYRFLLDYCKGKDCSKLASNLIELYNKLKEEERNVIIISNEEITSLAKRFITDEEIKKSFIQTFDNFLVAQELSYNIVDEILLKKQLPENIPSKASVTRFGNLTCSSSNPIRLWNNLKEKIGNISDEIPLIFPEVKSKDFNKIYSSPKVIKVFIGSHHIYLDMDDYRNDVFRFNFLTPRILSSVKEELGGEISLGSLSNYFKIKINPRIKIKNLFGTSIEYNFKYGETIKNLLEKIYVNNCMKEDNFSKFIENASKTETDEDFKNLYRKYELELQA